MSPPKKVLLAVTSAHAKLYPNDKETGMFVSEALHPYEVFTEAGFEVDIVSETGKYFVDWLSTTDDFLPAADRKIWEDENSGFRKALAKIYKASDVKAENYGIFFASAGHASLIDYAVAKDLQAVATGIYTNGGIVSAVCHGGAIFIGMNDPVTGKNIIQGKTITGFTDRGEKEEGVYDVIKSWDRQTIEGTAAKLGAHYVSPAGPWDDFIQVDGRIVTGANPASAKSTAEGCVEAYKKL